MKSRQQSQPIAATFNSSGSQGKQIVVQTGTLSASKAANPAIGSDITVTAPGLTPSLLGLQIQITSGPAIGSRAYLGAWRGNGVMQVTQWMVGDPVGGFAYGLSPSTGDSYRIVDLRQGGSNLLTTNFVFQYTHFSDPSSGTLTLSVWTSGVAGFADCIFDQPVIIPTGCNAFFFNCCFRAGYQFAPASGSPLMAFGGIVPMPGTFAKGILGNGSNVILDGDFACIGDNGNTASNAAIWVMQGANLVCNSGVSFWNTQLPLLISGGAVSVGGGPFGFSGLTDYTQISGSGNYHPVWLENSIGSGSSSLEIVSGSEFNPGTVKTVPTITATNAAPNMGACDFFFATVLNGTQSFGFSPVAGQHSGPRLNAWANLNLSVDSGGFATGENVGVVNPNTRYRYGSAVRPDQLALVQWVAFTANS